MNEKVEIFSYCVWEPGGASTYSFVFLLLLLFLASLPFYYSRFFFTPHLIRSSAICSSTNVTLVGISKFLSYPDFYPKSVLYYVTY